MKNCPYPRRGKHICTAHTHTSTFLHLWILLTSLFLCKSVLNLDVINFPSRTQAPPFPPSQKTFFLKGRGVEGGRGRGRVPPFRDTCRALRAPSQASKRSSVQKKKMRKQSCIVNKHTCWHCPYSALPQLPSHQSARQGKKKKAEV